MREPHTPLEMTMDNAFVEEVAASLVREFLSRKGLKKTIDVMDQELPRSDRSINNRNELRKLLNMEFLYKQNKTRESPLKTAIEIITRYFLEQFGKAALVGIQNSATSLMHKKAFSVNEPDKSNLNIYDISDSEEGGSTAVSETSKTEIYRSVGDISVLSLKSHATIKESTISAVSSGSSSEGETKEKTSIRKTTEDNLKSMEPSVEMKTADIPKPRSGRIVRGMMAGPISSSQEDSLKKRTVRRPPSATSITPSKYEAQLKMNSEVPVAIVQDRVESSSHSGSSSNTAFNLGKDFAARVLAESLPNSASEKMRRVSLGREDPLLRKTSERDRSGTDDCFKKNLDQTEVNEGSFKYNYSLESAGDGQEKRARGSKRNERVTSISNDRRKEDIKLDDVDDEMLVGEIHRTPVHCPVSKFKVEAKAIDFSQAKEMKTLLFGSSLCCFNEEWKMQSFTFSERTQLKYGIVQKKGGPCGVLAAVQGCVLQRLIFGEGSDSRCLKPSNHQRTNCLSMAIADILWRAGNRDHAVVALYSGRQQFSPVGRYKADGILEMILLYTLTKYEDLKTFLLQNIHQFEIGPFGCILLTFSVVFSRSFALVRADFDVPTNSLIGAHGYCTQELVNLLLTGKAVSNVFNDVVELDSGNGNITLLKGIDLRSDIGFLSLFEHHNVCQVGSYLKTPKYPIWVVCSESHFSIIFCLRKELMNDWKMERKFDLYYYDGLANQQEEIRLTVDTTATYEEGKDDELIPPLDHCIRTKWKGASVDWNGTEPIL
ncbi:probable ubiquitin carboxyl-terminal hydrolase MINDY-4 isoform X1 [Pleurodeles waltl]|uniref:probable ubiquitin carboxyl-terminal hydrolase MINDY-4 isoform X1 n=2 Tax=Pleurodeles waltl TaxID=8319 RepID=UPI0037095F85